MYVDGTSALQMLDQVFDVIEGGGSVPAGEVVEFVADNGTKIADVTTHTVNAANGAAAEVGEVVDIAAGATAGTATGAGIFTMEVGVAGAAIAPALGILAGVGLYNLAPEFWTNVSNTLVEAGKTVGGKLFGYVDKNGVTSFDEETIEIFKNAFMDAGLFERPETPEPLPEGDANLEQSVDYSAFFANFVSTWKIGANDPFNRYGLTGESFITAVNNWFSSQSLNISDYVCIAAATQVSANLNFYDKSRTWDILKNNIDEWHIQAQSGYCFGIHIEGNENQAWVITNTNPTDAFPNIEYNPTYDAKGLSNDFGTPTTEIQPPAGSKYASEYYRNFNVTINNGATQPDATLPTSDPFPLTYPTWTPYEFPETLPAYMPDVYPVALPTPGITQDPSQEGANETAPQQDSLVNLLYDTAPSNVPDVTPDTDPYAPPASEPTPPEPEPATDPIDPNPSPTPSGTTITLPTLDTTRASRMFTVYNPTDAQVDALGGFLWNSSIIEQIKKMWQNPLDGIISFHKVYCSPTVGSSKHIILGYIDSEVSALEVTSQFADVDCGTVHIPERLHNATDYSPFTALHCYLPFIGMVELDTDECMNADLHIKYRIDVYTGTCVALLYLERTVDMPNEQIVYTFSGNASQKLPLTAADFSGAVGALLGLAGAGVAVASGGSLGVAAGALSAAHSLTSEMVHIQHSGGLSANAGILSPRIPYLILSRQYGYDANAYNSFYGYPANKTVYIGNCTGYIKCKEVIFKGSCTEQEMNELTALLKEGVYV